MTVRPDLPEGQVAPPRTHTFAGTRLGFAAVAGVLAAVGAGTLFRWQLAPVVGWISAAGVFLLLTWLAVGRMNAEQTARYATREDPTAAVSGSLLIVASIASLGGVAVMLTDPGHIGKLTAALLGVASVAASWFTVHTLFTLRYAAVYYRGPDGGVSFNQDEPPAYADFAYLAFTLGMTYQVSDTDLTAPAIRRTALRHALLSYLLGAVVLAITINLVGSIAK